MFRLKSVFNHLLFCLGIAFLLLIGSASVFAADKPDPVGIKQGPEIFVQTGHVSGIVFLAMDKNERYLVSAENTGGNEFLKIWEISSGKEIRTIKIQYSLTNVYLTDDEKVVVVYAKYIEIYNMRGEKIEKIDLPKESLYKTFITKSRKYFYEDHLGHVRFFDLRDGSEIKIPEAEKSSGKLVSLGFGFFGASYGRRIDETGNGFITSYVIYDEDLKVRKRGIIKDKESISFYDQKVDPLLKFLYVGKNYEEKSPAFESYSLDTGALLCSINLKKVYQYPESKESFAFSVLADGRVLFDYSTFKSPFWDVAVDKKLSVIKYLDNCLYKEKSYSLNNVTSYISSSTSPGFLISGHFNGNIKMVNLDTGAEIKSFGVKPIALGNHGIGGVYFAADKMLNIEGDSFPIKGRVNFTYNLWNIKEAKLEKAQEASSSGLYDKNEIIKGQSFRRPTLIDPDAYYAKIPKLFLKKDYRNEEDFDRYDGINRILKSSYKEGYTAGNEGPALVLRKWPAKSEIARFYAFTDGEWIVITPEGYYNASPNGDRYLNVRVGKNIYGIENYRESFYRPDLVKVALSGGSLNDFRKLADVKQPPLVTIIDTPKTTNKDEVTVKLQITDNGGGIGDIKLYLNGTSIMLDSRGIQLTKKQNNGIYKSYQIKLTNGSNTIKALAFNTENTMQSNEAVQEITASLSASVKPRLHALIIGINEYDNPNLKLMFARADAELFASTIKEATVGLFGEATIKLLVNKEETSSGNIIQELKSMQKLHPDDLFIFYVASHGIVDNGEYFMLTSDVGSLSSAKLKEKAISQTTLKELIANIPATKKLIVIDTCSAGALGDAIQMAMMTRGVSEETAMKILSYAVGSMVISASTSTQEALEGYKGHGLFTYVITEGLKGKADSDKDGFVKTLELANYVDDEVPALAEKIFHRKQYPTCSPNGMAFPIGRTVKQ